MFNKIKSLFFDGETNHSSVENNDFLSFENPNFIIDPEQISAILTEIELNSPLCTIQIDGVTKNYNSSILGIKPEKNLIVLDELVPKEGNITLQNKKSLKLTTFHKGIYLTFTLSDLEIGYSRGITYYKAPLPDRIFYPQRRRSPRIEISSIDIAFNGISERTGISVTGYLFDLSRGGAGIDLTGNMARIQRGDLIKNCQINLEDYLMDFDFSVRFVKSASNNSSKTQIGGFFERVSSKSHGKLSHFITSLERIEIRKLKA